MRATIFGILSGFLSILSLLTGGLLLFCGAGWHKLGSIVLLGYFVFFGYQTIMFFQRKRVSR
jgi:hypothetical protein